jgi:branched-chain amino acid transport system permease protein
VTATLIGTLVMIFLYQWLTIYGSQYAIVVMGVILVLTVLFAPEGIVLSLMRGLSARLKPAGARQ